MGGVEGLAFVNTKFANVSDDYPDFEIHMSSATCTTDNGRGIKQYGGLSDEVLTNVLAMYRQSIGCLLANGQTLSAIQ